MGVGRRCIPLTPAPASVEDVALMFNSLFRVQLTLSEHDDDTEWLDQDLEKQCFGALSPRFI